LQEQRTKNKGQRTNAVKETFLKKIKLIFIKMFFYQPNQTLGHLVTWSLAFLVKAFSFNFFFPITIPGMLFR